MSEACHCPDWKTGNEFLSMVTVSHQMRYGKLNADGVYPLPDGVKMFNYCPWCGAPVRLIEYETRHLDWAEEQEPAK